ncbi:ChuX/HutX family heme-like substrate-binding protein [Ideonella sp. DXS29W]|uniref:ChuX/HutX family heme-like substrate-binding protein n=1 Tax=Ideonella lacteola TaxID=2984193 RepID=A0ABU9BKG7_9BURK
MHTISDPSAPGTLPSPESLAALRRAFAEARRPPARRHRDIADELGISEGELIAAHAGGVAPGDSPLRAQRLRPRWPSIVEALETLGEVTALTRNASCVHEKVGIYRGASVEGQVGLVLGGDIDLRVFYNVWAHGFAVEEHTPRGLQRSLQFFDAEGTAIHKVFLRDGSDLAAYARLVDAVACGSSDVAGLTPHAAAPRPAEKPDDEVDVAAFQADWSALRDTHEFFGMLRRHGLSRTQALRLASPEFVQPADPGAAQELLVRAAQQAVPIMVFVGNPGLIQIHSGPVRRVEQMGPWVNVLDPGFNLHLREDHIAQAWLVRKPTVDGLVSSLEVFDAAGLTVAMFFGERKPGQAERCDWRDLLAGVANEAGAGCAA